MKKTRHKFLVFRDQFSRSERLFWGHNFLAGLGVQLGVFLGGFDLASVFLRAPCGESLPFHVKFTPFHGSFHTQVPEKSALVGFNRKLFKFFEDAPVPGGTSSTSPIFAITKPALYRTFSLCTAKPKNPLLRASCLCGEAVQLLTNRSIAINTYHLTL